jgi:Mg2+ and Co2+ transporter CorA
MQKIVAYNDKEVKESDSKEDIKQGYNIWIDLVDPTKTEIQMIQELFSLDIKTIEIILNKSKKPRVCVLDGHSFTIILSIKYKDLQTHHRRCISISW